MTSSRLVVVFVLLGSGLAFAQTLSPSSKAVTPADPQSAVVAPEPSKILPGIATGANVLQDPQAKLEASQLPRDREGSNPDAKVLLTARPIARDFVIPPFAFADGTCFALRSYVVARDSKNSDSTHPVRYSTCVPANKYRIRKVDDSDQAAQAKQGSK